jgi:CRISPR-associated protein Cst2
VKKVPDDIATWIKSNNLNTATEVDLNCCQQPDGQNWEGVKWYSIQGPVDKLRGVIGIQENKTNGRIVFLTTKEEYQRRVEQLITVIKNGLILHSSTEDYGVVPVFIVLGALKVPVPLFNSAVLLDRGKINADLLNHVLDNSYVVKAWYDGIMPFSGNLRTKSEKGENVYIKWNGIKDVVSMLSSEAS